jgi:PAS domain S-box-containing protein
MKYEKKTRKQLVEELQLLQARISELESRAPRPVPEAGKPAKMEERFQIIFNKSLDATLVIDGTSGKILAANESTANVLGYENDSLVGKHFSILFSTAGKGEKKQTAKLLESYDSVFTQEFLRADGTVCAMDLIATLIPWGKEKAILAAFRDATERKAAEARVQNLLAQVTKGHDDFLSILNMLKLGIVALDAEGRINFVNAAARKMIGKGGRKIYEKFWNRVLPFQKEDFPRIETMLRRAAPKRKKIEAKFGIPGKKGIWLEVEINDDPRDPDRKIMALYDMSEVYDLRHLLEKSAKFQDIVGKSEPMQAVYARIKEVATVDWTVLIQGQTGTGKELVARAIHATSHRRDKPFIAVNCAGLEDSLLTSQLFGHRRGAFTGAVEDHKGFFEAAAGGTLFLDEIGDISKSMQASLLRVLEEKEITRVGESRPRKVDVRILAATHRNLSEAAEAGNFRRDLLYRIRVARIALPPLRERREDIPLLYETFLAVGRAVTGKSVQRLSDDALRLLLNYDWPGNVRELKSVVESAILGCKGAVIHKKDLPFEIINAEALHETPDLSFNDDKSGMLAALEKARGSRTKAAGLLGMSRATFYRRLDDYGIKPSK